MDTAALTSYLHDHIPLTRAMAIAVAACDGRAVTLEAPLAPNLNHTDTAFGGSLATLGIVAGWSLLHATLADRQVSARLLIQHSATDFLRPADGDLRVTCAFADAATLEAFLAALRDRRRARMELEARVYSRGTHAATHAATHHGTYVALLY